MARPEAPIDVRRAQRQHADYVQALSRLGLRVIELEADERCPDCCFVEDTCVMVGDRALLTRPGAESRRGEVDAVGAAIRAHREVAVMQAPATLDGGDCMRVGRTLFVGRSSRTNDEGVALLRTLADAEGCAVVPLALPSHVLHLKSVCSSLGDIVLLAEGTLTPSAFANARVVLTPSTEPHGANLVFVNGRALVAADAPRTRSIVEGLGVEVVTVDTSELRKADGALTCLSILL